MVLLRWVGKSVVTVWQLQQQYQQQWQQMQSAVLRRWVGNYVVFVGQLQQSNSCSLWFCTFGQLQLQQQPWTKFHTTFGPP